METDREFIMVECPNCKGDLNEFNSTFEMGEGNTTGIIYLSCEDCEKMFSIPMETTTTYLNSECEEISEVEGGLLK